MDWSEEHDVLVAGSGGGGVTGAYTAAREGLDVLLVEATDKFGGTTAYSGGGGVWFPCNPVLVRAGTDDTIEDALTYYHAVVGDRTPRELQETFVRGGAPLIEYLEQDPDLKFVPLPWPDYYGKAPKARLDGQRHIAAKPLKVAAAPELRDAIRGPLDTDRLGVETPPDYYIGGRALIARFLKAIGQYPTASLRRDTALVELVVSQGRVTRRDRRERGGTPRDPHPPGCAAGRRRLREQRGAAPRIRCARRGAGHDGIVPGSRGLALQAGIAAGADIDLMDQAWWSPGMTHPDGRSAFALWFTGGIFVNQNGDRFVNESRAYDRAGREIIAQLRDGSITLPYWMIYDDKEGEVPPVKAANVTIVDTEKYVAAGLWHTADTLEELADKIGVPAGRLTATVARFNDFAAAGVDEDFGRGDEAFDRAFSGGASPLVSIDQPPFHAAAFGISDLGTKGGLRTDTAARVLDVSGKPIPGLYAAGNTMAAPSGTAYPGGGNPIGTSMLFSHLAVMDMLEGDR